MRNSIQNNEDGDRNEIFVACGDSFTDKHGDRTGVALWGYDENKKMFFVNRKSKREEYFRFRSQFSTFTAVGLYEMLRPLSTIHQTTLRHGTSKYFLKIKPRKVSLDFPPLSPKSE